MKQKLIDWLIAKFIHRIKVSPILFAIIASVLGALIWGINYFQGLGYDLPEWVTSNEALVGYVIGLLLQGHSSKYVEPGKPTK